MNAKSNVVRLLLWLMLMLPVAVRGQFAYTTSNGLITITGYNGTTTVLTIPDTINSRSVASIGINAFTGNSRLTSVTLPKSITNIGANAFSGCFQLTNIMVDALNPNYSGLEGVLFDKTRATLFQYPQGKAGGYTVPASVTNIGAYAFNSCTRLTEIIIGNSVITVGNSAFNGCSVVLCLLADFFSTRRRNSQLGTESDGNPVSDQNDVGFDDSTCCILTPCSFRSGDIFVP